MKSKLIRILIILCVVGVVAFGVVALLVNYNVEQKAYNEISTIRDNADFDKFYRNADGIKTSHSGGQCSYVKYVNTATRDLNDAIDYYLNYLQNMSGMNKNDKTDLVDKYRAYISAINDAKTAKSKYDTFNDSTKEDDKTQVAVQSANFAKAYLLAYGKGYKFFITLQDIVEQKVFGGDMFKSYTLAKYEMESVFVNQSINKLIGELEKKIINKSYTSKPESASVYANNFNILNKRTVSAVQETTSTYSKFLANYNKISDVRAFLADSKTYIVNNEKETSASSVKTFLRDTLGLNMEGTDEWKNYIVWL